MCTEPYDGPSASALLPVYEAEIASHYPGWDLSSGPSATTADFAPPDGAFVVVYDGQDRPVACGAFKRLAGGAAEIKRVYVTPDARGAGLARRLLAHLEGLALDAGYDVVRLDTGAHQPAALHLFRSVGYREIADYNGNPFASYWFEKRLDRGTLSP